ncbi:MAG: exo-alpha-sialidase [Candidatus Solibacter usitatus]|nr:exo-alpha-sialidase [Candidatus Solibacter usitatus]
MRVLMNFSLAALLLSAALATAQPRVVVSDPTLVAEAPAEVRRWGYYQFPTLDRAAGGRILLTFHVHPDSARSYGLAADVPNRGISSDNGRTWTLTSSTEPAPGIKLPNGDRLRIVTPKAVPAGELRLPAPVGTRAGTYGNLPYVYYRLDELPEMLRGVPLARLAKGAESWSDERAALDDPAALRYTVEGVFPVVWWGDVRVAPDRSLLAVVYPGRMAGPHFKHCHAFCYRSTDHGRTWKVQGRILYEPDPVADPKAASRDGFSEPAFEILRDGSLLCVLRTTDGLGVGPMFYTRSGDMGKTWSRPQAFTPTGVLPRLLRLGNGTLVLSSGRPGVDLRFSFDGRGEKWSEPHKLVPISSGNAQADSCGYTSLLPLSDSSLLVAYSWFQRPAADGTPRKAILVRRVDIR